MVTRIRTLNFLPEIFQTSTNAQFLGATLDQLVAQPNTKKIEGYIGSKFGNGVNAKDYYYVVEPTKTRKDYQLDPGVVFTKPNEGTPQDFISYPGIIDALKLEGSITPDNNRLFNSEFYSWDSFTSLDKIINFSEYYWLPEGPQQVVVSTEVVFGSNDYVVLDAPNGYNIIPVGSTGGSTNPTLTLLRGGTYTFAVSQDSQFWIQGEPGTTGYSPLQPNLLTREIYGVNNNGAETGVVTFNVPSKDAQNEYNFPGNNPVGVVSTLPFSQVNGAKLSTLGGIDNITSLNGLTVLFYNTGVPAEIGYVSNYYGYTPWDNNNDLVASQTITVTATSSTGNKITCNDTTNLLVGSAISFTGVAFGGLLEYTTSSPTPISAGTFSVGQQYAISGVGDTDWVTAGVTASAVVTGSISGTSLTITGTSSGILEVGQTITGVGITSGTKIVSYDLPASWATAACAGNFVLSTTYIIQDLGTTTQLNWNTIAGTIGVTYVPGSSFTCANIGTGLGNGTAFIQVYTVDNAQTAGSTTITCYDINPGTLFTAAAVGSGTGTAVLNLPALYYIDSVPNGTQFTVSTSIGGPVVTLSNATGSMIGNINQGLFEEGYYTNVDQYFYTINFIGDTSDPILQLTPTTLIPTNQKIIASHGTEWVSRNFYKNIAGTISLIPYISAPLDILYYQDGTSDVKVGIIKLIESNVNNTLDVEQDILGHRTFTASTGVVFTNGLKVVFQGDVIPEKYKTGQYYVEGVGTAIELILASDLIVPESFTSSTYIPWDTSAWDISNWEGDSYIPVLPDYLTIARNAINQNAWSRSNRWVHIDVINATASYNNNPASATAYATLENKAKRPIIEFYPNLKLFNSGTEGKAPIDFIDFRTSDAFSLVAGEENYYPDVNVYTTYTGAILSTDYISAREATATTTGTNIITCNDTTGFRVNDLIVFNAVELGPVFGGVVATVNYYIKEVVGPNSFTITPVQDGTTEFALSTDSGSMRLFWTPHSTEIIIDNSDITGTFTAGQYVTDSTNMLPINSMISEVVVSTTQTTLNVTWDTSVNSFFVGTTTASIIATDTTNDNYALFDGARIVFAADTDVTVKNKIYISRFSTVSGSLIPVITLTESEDSLVLPDQQTVTLRGFSNQGVDFYFNGIDWIKSQQKTQINQSPLFDVLDDNGISFGNTDVYVGSSFVGNKLFAYGVGVGVDDKILNFPIRYSAVNNLGDISFDVSLNSDTFDYVSGSTPITQKVNTGYVYDYFSRTEFNRALGWQTAVSPSAQYQVFEFTYDITNPTTIFTCDIATIDSSTTNWPIVQVYINNAIQTTTEYTFTATSNTTTVTLATAPTTNTVVQVLVLSDQVSPTAYYNIPINLNNNPFNTDITTANLGDIKGQYQSIFYNNSEMTGVVFGSNNFRDLGNVVPYGTRIIQNSASLVLPSIFLRKQNHNLFNSLLFNSREYIKFKTLLVDTVNNSDYVQRFDAATMLDDALDQLTSAKTNDQSFFWSDMLPSKAAYITNNYSFANSLDVSIYPLSRVYDFTKANYYGVLVYLIRTTNGVTVTTQLIKDQDYAVSIDAPSLTVNINLLPNDKIIIKEYTQTYGTYAPNTPTKLGLYPAYTPKIILDADYTQPTYFIRGHDGSYTKLYGDYDPTTGILIDFRDQVLYEYELRVFNNLKVSTIAPVQLTDILPGFFRDTDYSYAEFLEIYSTNFLDWVGQNRINYKRQLYNKNDQYTYNYYQSGNKVNKQPIQQGYWRGIYQYYYDTTTPNITPWEMLGFIEQPSWWTDRYGLAPYTSDNLILWNDLAEGVVWNNGNSYIIPNAVRTGLLNVIPVNSAGELLSPFDAIVGNYNSNIFQRDWKVGDGAPVEFSYRRSSSWPFDMMRILALTKPAKFFNLSVDVDNYKYSTEFNQYLVNNRSHLVIDNIDIYGTGIAKTSYINWIVDYEKQLGVDATTNIVNLLYNLDVRLIYRVAGFSDKKLLKFYVEKGTPNSKNASLLIPDESYTVLLYDNQPFDKILYSGVVIQMVNNGYAVYGNSQTSAYFKTLTPSLNGNYSYIEVEKVEVKLSDDYVSPEVTVPYGTLFYSLEEVSQFLCNYGAYLQRQGMLFDSIENGLEINWKQMVAEFLYWAQTGWEQGSVITLNPSATLLSINKDGYIVQPLTMRQTNFVLNQNLYPIPSKDLSVVRDDTLFTAAPMNQGDSIAYGQFNINNIEHGVVFNNLTLFDDVIYNLTTGLRQTRIAVRGTKTADWNGTVNAAGFILNQDNILDWSREIKYTKGSIVKYKNKYWTASAIVQPTEIFDEKLWKRTEYDEIQKGLLPNPSTRSYESTLYYDIDKANLEQDADLLSFSLIGYRPRDYLALADLTDITQVNVYKNLIKEKGTLNAASAFKGATLPQGGINYDIYENWAIKSGEFGGVLNSNFAEFKINEKYMTGNPSIVGLTSGIDIAGVQQEVPLYSLYNYGRPISSPDILSEISAITPSLLFPDAGYANFNDVKMSSFYYSALPLAVNTAGTVVPIQKFYVRDYVWLANYLSTWQVFTPVQSGIVVNIKNNLNGTITITFNQPHNLTQYQPFAIVNFASEIDGYYIASLVVDTYRIIVNLTLAPSIRDITGQGIGLQFQSQRVNTPAAINDLPLLTAEFTKNTVWVDTNDDGAWAVYRKSINYKFEEEILHASGQSLGSAVAYTSSLGYLISDATLGVVYRYTYNDLYQTYQLTQTITESTSFGTTIAYADDIFVISEPTGAKQVHIYQLENTLLSDDMIVYQTPIAAPANSINWGKAVAISGDKNWIYISDFDNTSTPNRVYVYRKSQITNEYEYSTYITTSGLTSGDNFGYSIATDYYGDTVVIGTPNQDFSGTIDNWGYTYIFARTVQNIEAQYNSIPLEYQTLQLGWAPITVVKTITATNGTTNYITCSNTTSINVDDPVIFAGLTLQGTEISPNDIYYVHSISGSDIKIKTTRAGTTPFQLGTVASLSATATFQTTPLYVSVNGTLVDDSNYAVSGSTLLLYTGILQAGDIINVSASIFTLMQTLTTNSTPRVGVHFGNSVDLTAHGSEIIVGAPFELTSQNIEGAVYRYTNGGCKYGIVIGTSDVDVTSPRQILINGFLVFVPIGNATVAANAINIANISNILATASDGKLIISLIDSSLAIPNEKINVTAFDTVTLTQLGIELYTPTQTVLCPHTQGRTQFGTIVKFNEFDSFIVSAPVGSRYVATTFDFTDDENLDNDTLFDNNATQWIDIYPNVGAVYMFDYLPVNEENLNNLGKFVYAQSINALNEENGLQPMYGQALDFNNYHVVVGTPNFRPSYDNGQIITYSNTSGVRDWAIHRKSAPVVDIDRIQNIQLFSATTNNTLINLDYIDPLQGKILGATRQNIDVISNIDPAHYNNPGSNSIGLVWGANNIGQLWFDTSNVRFVNYHQDDVSYNSKYWGTLFPGSDVAVYSWISSNVPPISYAGTGTPYNIQSYAIQQSLTSTGTITPVYYYWVRNTNIVFEKNGKTLADSTIQSYIASPKNSGISYFAPLLPNVFGLYNTETYINANDSILHIGFSTGTNADVSHSQFSLIRAGISDDFLPGIPEINSFTVPESLYDRMLDSLSGVDESGSVVPNPYLPKAVQHGVLARPRQSFFINRFDAVNNYFGYANTVLSQFPITETRQYSFLFSEGTTNPSTGQPFFATTNYWEYANWWAAGYSDNTKAALQVPLYADLSTITVNAGTIVSVAMNGNGHSETYILTNAGNWERIGLENGTIRFKSSLWDYTSARLGFGDNFFDTTPYDDYPSEETRTIARALNEQIYTNDLLIYRNESLILLFEYIQSEATESQNYLTWLNKTSFIDVAHTIRELLPIEVFQSDNQDFLSGYMNEVKPYHVVIKEFLFKYTKLDIFAGGISDFDIPATYDTSVQQFVSPQLVYSNPNSYNQFLPTDTIWNSDSYKAWYTHHGISITGQTDVQITTLASYIALNTAAFAVDNASGFPVTGIVTIGTEQIGYSYVDRVLNVLGGLTRGVNETPINNHIPADLIYINLSPALLLDGGRGYANPPKITAYIDTTIYPEPTRPAVLKAVMSLDSVISIDVIDPGQGYPILPEIIIEPSAVVTFASSAVNTMVSTIQLYAPLLQTSDLIKYNVGTNSTAVGGLIDNQWYYVNVLETVPTVTIAVYKTYRDSIIDQNRIELFNSGTGVNHTFSLGAKAACISSALPVRENNIELRFDRTSYDSSLIDWISGRYYGSFYAGSYSNSESVSSSSMLLESTQPPIETILASGQGVAFEIVDVEYNQSTTYSSLIRLVESTVTTNNVIRLIPLDDGSSNLNASGSTIGFYLNMPIKFAGGVCGGIVANTVY